VRRKEALFLLILLADGACLMILLLRSWMMIIAVVMLVRRSCPLRRWSLEPTIGRANTSSSSYRVALEVMNMKKIDCSSLLLIPTYKKSTIPSYI
jgi:hypothetical protein